MSEFYRTMRKLLAEHGSVERRTDTGTGKEALFLDGRFIIGEEGDYSQTERIKTEPVLILFGAGHVGKALYDLAMLQHHDSHGQRDRVLAISQAEVINRSSKHSHAWHYASLPCKSC